MNLPLHTIPLWWLVSIGSGNGLMPSGNKPFPESVLTHIFSPYGVTRPQWVKLVSHAIEILFVLSVPFVPKTEGVLSSPASVQCIWCHIYWFRRVVFWCLTSLLLCQFVKLSLILNGIGWLINYKWTIGTSACILWMCHDRFSHVSITSCSRYVRCLSEYHQLP